MKHDKSRDCDCEGCRSYFAYIDKIVDEAPPLTAEQRAKLAELLEPVRIRRAK